MGSQTKPGITERKRRLDGSVAEFACEPLLVEPGRRAALRYVSDREWTVHGGAIRVPVGTVTIGHYWADRPYNVYHWLVSDREGPELTPGREPRRYERSEYGLVAGRTLAYYCNVATDTRIAVDAVDYLDLTVDVLIQASGQPIVLDEDELPEDLAPPYRLAIAQALDQLVANPRMVIREIERETAALLRGR